MQLAAISWAQSVTPHTWTHFRKQNSFQIKLTGESCISGKWTHYISVEISYNIDLVQAVLTT